jgi:hypothetical protein
MNLTERIFACLQRHPDWDTARIAKSCAARHGDVDAVRRGEQVPDPGTAEQFPKQEPASAPAGISLAAVKQRFDIAGAISRAVKEIRRGTLLPEDELCRLTAGRDRSRFRRAVENNPELSRAHRVRLRLDDSSEGKFYWGHAEDIAEAIRLRDM